MSSCLIDIPFCNNRLCSRINNTVGQPFYYFPGLCSPRNTATVPGQQWNTNPLKHLRIFYNSIPIHNTQCISIKRTDRSMLFMQPIAFILGIIRNLSIHSGLNARLLNG